MQIEQVIMTRAARRYANNASADQLAFLFDEAPVQPIVTEPALPPAPIVEVVRQPRRRAPQPKREARRALHAVPAEDRQLTVEETAELLSVSIKTLEAWRRLGKGPEFVKLGRSVRYTMRALDEFTLERTVRNSAEGRMLDMPR